ncbi:hypothetical protein [Frigoriflavimonas asaccharolytica]|uniref:ABC-type transport system involved in Fe-S cluster assembly fused permease/ATPase subunit n=1 Tax=Frigoriflavimonas asaccharolytica TaxID=2735899 RepID=A0A8J8GA19_9FLAO|nr:hypothetical protein [Frigoriflavimonas asaccharolytica]NRS94138.1 ABC-type transport system involved in Fe-S cluster assembly fused permease/ATPase subunit [Frigoriflavimonas asaccharolytica]
MFKNNLSLVIILLIFGISCKKNNISTIYTKNNIDTLFEQPKNLYFDGDNIIDTVKIRSKSVEKVQNFELLLHLSTLGQIIEIPIINNSILYNNNYSVYYVSDPIISDENIQIRIDYADQVTKLNISGEKKNLIEKIKYRFDVKNRKIQIIGYELSYNKNKNSNYKKSFNFITGKYYSSSDVNGIKKDGSGWSMELENIYIKTWDSKFLSKLLMYGNEVE